MSREFYVPCNTYAYPQQQQQQQEQLSGGVTSPASSGQVHVDSVNSGEVGMDCTALRPGPFNYLITEQAKSLVALQELQNEVGALLEFRDLVIETFPNLRQKMSSSGGSPLVASSVLMMSSSSQTSSSNIPLALSMSPSSRRTSEWEPGKVRRRVAARDRDRDHRDRDREIGESSATSLPRSRSNSQSGGNGGGKNSGTVQDSGFSTETSSKDSASTAIPRPTSPRPLIDEAEDELWNLLDVIHRKGVKLREEVESLQERLENSGSTEIGQEEQIRNDDIFEAVQKVTNDETEIIRRVENPAEENDERLTILGREKERLVDRVARLEAETINGRTRARELENELAALSALRNALEDRLKTALETKNDESIQITPTSPPPAVTSVAPNCKTHHKNRFRTRTIEKNVLANGAVQNGHRDCDQQFSGSDRVLRLGTLDDVLIDPNTLQRVAYVDNQKIAAILREHSALELQRHLITTTVHNQCLQDRLEKVEKSTETLSDRLDKAREENDDLRFQLEERNIELEGTRARVRVLERLQQRVPTEEDPLANPLDVSVRCEGGNYAEPGSSTESARDHNHHEENSQLGEIKASPRRRPSRIPLPGSSSGAIKSLAPKPPQPASAHLNKNESSARESLKSLTTRPPRDASRDSITARSSLSRARDSSRESLNKSLSKSSANFSGKQETSRESLNRSLSRNNNSTRDSLNKSSSSLSRTRDSLESNNLTNNTNHNPPGTPPRRPPAPNSRRSQSLARNNLDTDNGKGLSDPPTSWCSSSSTSSCFRHSDSSLYPDSLNQEETTSATGSTRVEFILGSPTRRFRPNSGWPSRFLDSINSATGITAESLITDEFPLRRGEALAECDSLECHPISSEG